LSLLSDGIGFACYKRRPDKSPFEEATFGPSISCCFVNGPVFKAGKKNLMGFLLKLVKYFN